MKSASDGPQRRNGRNLIFECVPTPRTLSDYQVLAIPLWVTGMYLVYTTCHVLRRIKRVAAARADLASIRCLAYSKAISNNPLIRG